MTYSISKDFAFCASHVLSGLPDDHPCARVHGHNYVVRVELGADQPDSTGFILDYRALAPFGDYIDEHLDHRHLNDVVPVNPTAEWLARFLRLELGRLVDLGAVTRCAVGVSETPKTWAWYRDP